MPLVINEYLFELIIINMLSFFLSYLSVTVNSGVIVKNLSTFVNYTRGDIILQQLPPNRCIRFGGIRTSLKGLFSVPPIVRGGQDIHHSIGLSKSQRRLALYFNFSHPPSFYIKK